MSTHQSRMAVESRAYPLFRYDPAAGTTFEECCSIEGNPDLDQDWISWTLKYQDEKGGGGGDAVPFTFADFAMNRRPVPQALRKAPPDTWNDSMVPLPSSWISPRTAARPVPYVWAWTARTG